MPLPSPGSIVQRDGALWRVSEITDAVGGGKVAQIECLDRDAHAAVDVERLDDVVEMTPEAIAAAIERREKREAPKRVRHAIRLHDARIKKCRAMRAEVSAARDEAKRRLDAGDLRAVENREIVPGQVIRIEPAGLVSWADKTIASLDAAVEKASADRAKDVATLATLEG